MATLKFKTNINCANCIRSVTPFLNDLDSIETWKVDTENPDKILIAEGDDLTIEEVETAVKKAGFIAAALS
jgi:copper chaperone